MHSIPVGPKSCPVVCPSCKATINTKVDSKTTVKTHFMALLLCSCVVCSLCSCMPYCMKSCRNADHYCPNCGTYLGTYKR
ncbi:hypothetical protein B5X24_HaOG205670 [Helicoverpa armigera]|uniref:LITAF domain-containing protein n=1 Tax=Helicoverpa armigera TaxID=29058 RepID=A0A2W1BVG7_HELAM|nr:hypothetical protein B5X24_HaOG205670 [Helicoverpa armigera]